MRLAVALVRSTHPGPSAAVTLVTIVLGVTAGLDPVRVVVLAVVMLLDQFSVGLSNDWLDADRDRAVARSDKPVARGDVASGTVRTAAFATAAASVLLSTALGWPLVVAHLVALASAWSYNIVAKHTVASVLPFIVSFGLLPVLATLALPEPRPAQWWVIAAGALLGVAAHVANVLPDLADDASTGVRGLPHRLGRIPSALLAAVALVAASLAFTLGPGLSPAGAVGLSVSVVIAAAAVTLILTDRLSRWLFRLIIAAAVLDVVLLALAGSAIVG